MRTISGRILNDPHDVDEVVSDTFVHVWKKAGAFQADRGSPVTLLAVIARCRAIDKLRSKVRRKSELSLEVSMDVISSKPSPESVSILAQRSNRLRVALAQLPVGQRQAIELAYFRGKSHTEIATHTSLSLGSAKTRVRLGLKKLRQILEN